MTDSQRTATEGELRRQLAGLGDRSTRAIAYYAEANNLVTTDLRALVLLHSAEQAGQQPLTPGDLSRHLDLSSGAVTYLVDRLTKADCVVAVRDVEDRRRSRISCTSRGSALVRKFESGMHSVGTLALMDLPDEDLQAAVRVLSRLELALDSYCERFDA